MYNHVILLGNLTNKPEKFVTKKGVICSRFRLAVSRPYSNTTDFFTIVAWRKLAEAVLKFVHKGDHLLVSGSLHIDKVNNIEYITIVANNIRLFYKRQKELWEGEK